MPKAAGFITVNNRRVDPEWACQRSGDCCRSVPEIVMTVQERDTVVAFLNSEKREAEAAKLRWVAGPRPTPGVEFVALKPFAEGLGCPLLSVDGSGTPTCTVHQARPYNCRRFGCLRPDVRIEPYESEEWDPERGRYGCRNLSDRILGSRVARRLLGRIQRKAQRWAVAHGWRDDNA